MYGVVNEWITEDKSIVASARRVCSVIVMTVGGLVGWWPRFGLWVLPFSSSECVSYELLGVVAALLASSFLILSMYHIIYLSPPPF